MFAKSIPQLFLAVRGIRRVARSRPALFVRCGGVAWFHR